LGWSAEKFAELYYLTDDYDSILDPMLDKWFSFLQSNITSGSNWRIPAKLSWSGQPSQGLNSLIMNNNQDVGIASSMVHAMLWYGEADGNQAATDLSVALLDSLIDNNLDNQGIAADDPRDDYHRFWAQCDFAVALAAADYFGVSGGTAINPPTVTIPPGLQGDANDDGSVNIVDAIPIAQYYVGQITEFPC
jgi:hypothetical protein